MFAQRKRPPAPRRGAILVLVAIVLPVLAMMMAFAIDVAWMQLVNTELRTATDSAARAGAKTLSLTQSKDQARAAAIDAASRNRVAGDAMRIAGTDVQFGLSEQPSGRGRFVFTPGESGAINAIHVDGRRTEGSAAGPVDLFFARVVGVDHFQPHQRAISTILDRDICLVIDRSGSMGLDAASTATGSGQTCGPLDPNTRFGALDRAVAAFLSELDLTLSNEHVALASYSSDFSARCSGFNLRFGVADIREPLTGDYAAIRGEMDQFMQRGIGGRTAIGEGLRQGIRAITSNRARPLAAKTIVLMTDGLHNTGVEPAVIARQAASQDITVHTVTFSPGADQSRMRQVARITGGQHFHADTAGDLSDVFREIARTLPVLLTQ